MMRIKKKRLQIDMSEDAFNRLEKLRDKSGSQTNTEVCRKSLRLFDTIINYEKDGFTLYMRTPKGEEIPFPLSLLN